MLPGLSADFRGFSCKPKNFQQKLRGTPNFALMIIRQDLWWGHAACIDPSPGTWMHEKYRSLWLPLLIPFVSLPPKQQKLWASYLFYILLPLFLYSTYHRFHN